MRLTISLTAVAALTIWTPALAQNAVLQLNKTSWAFANQNGTLIRMSVDDHGNYIENTVAGKHHDHGTATIKGGKFCFTSAMDSRGEVCWTGKATKIGETMMTTSDKGETLQVTRVAYTPLAMPK